MGAQVRAQQQAEVQRAEAELARLNRELELDLAQAALDVAGIADPTPISDGLSAAISLGRGDLFGFGASLLSMIPYAGDALGKTAKGARLARRIAGLRRSIEAAMASINLLRRAASPAARRAAAARVRAQRRASNQVIRGCTRDFNTRLPADGAWAGNKGNSAWTPDLNTQRGRDIWAATGDRPIRYVSGYPDFSPHVFRHNGTPARVEIDMRGNTTSDFRDADAAMRRIDPNWRKPRGWTWHHHPDGVTMELVPENLNNLTPHTGGASIVTDPGY